MLFISSLSRGKLDDALPWKNRFLLPVRCEHFRAPVSASVLSAENQPAHLQSAEVRGAVRTVAGPIILRAIGGMRNSWARAEWDLELENGALCRCHEEDGAWKVDGIYD